jgi:hypothetical protein
MFFSKKRRTPGVYRGDGWNFGAPRTKLSFKRRISARGGPTAGDALMIGRGAHRHVGGGRASCLVVPPFSKQEKMNVIDSEIRRKREIK